MILESYTIIDEDCNEYVITEEVDEVKKEARAYILRKMNEYIKQNTKGDFKANTAPAAMNFFCTDPSAKLMVITANPAGLRMVGMYVASGALGAAAGATGNPILLAGSLVAGGAIGTKTQNRSAADFLEFAKSHKKELEDYVNDGWEHKIKITKCLKASGPKDPLKFPDRIVIEFTKNGGSKSSKNESAIFEW